MGSERKRIDEIQMFPLPRNWRKMKVFGPANNDLHETPLLTCFPARLASHLFKSGQPHHYAYPDNCYADSIRFTSGKSRQNRADPLGFAQSDTSDGRWGETNKCLRILKYRQKDYKMGNMKRTTILIIAMLIACVFASTTLISRNTSGNPQTPVGSFTNMEILDNRRVTLTLGVFVPYTRYQDCQIVVRDPLCWTARWNPEYESTDWVDNVCTMRDAFPGVNISINDPDGNRRLTPGDLLSIDAGSGYLAKGNWSVSLLYMATGGTTIIEKTFQIVNDYPDPYPRYIPSFPLDLAVGTMIVVAALITVSLILYRRRGRDR